MNMYIPIVIIVVSNILYNMSTKLTPKNINPFAALTVTYLVGALVSCIIFFLTDRSGNLLSEYSKLNWSSFALGFAIVGLEAGSIYMYKAGWNVSTGQLVYSMILALCLITIGVLFFKEAISTTKIIGFGICLVGLFLINK